MKRLQNALSMPSNADLKTIITMNMIQNNQITHEDINLAEQTFGKSIGTIKGKTICKNETFDKTDSIEIPEELMYKNRNLELSIDTMYVNGMLFLTKISHDIYYRTSQYLPSKHKNNHIKCMEEILTLYKIAGFNIIAIHCDQEFKYALQDFANQHNITLLSAPSQSHIPRAEKNIRMIKERVRSLFHTLPFRTIPKTILKYLMIQITAMLNYFPARYGISKYISPRMIIHKRVLNYDMHCKHYTGEYVLAHDDQQIKNNMKTRAIDCIYLRPSINSKNVHEFYNIKTKQVITRRYCTSIPTPENTINKIERHAKNDNMILGITFKPKHIDNYLWLAGVEEHDDEEEHNKDKINNNNQNVNDNQEMDTNNIHEIMHDPYAFHIPNQNHQPSIQEEQYERPNITDNITPNYTNIL